MFVLPADAVNAILQAAAGTKAVLGHAEKDGPLHVQDRWKAAAVRRHGQKLLGALEEYVQVHDALRALEARKGGKPAKHK